MFRTLFVFMLLFLSITDSLADKYARDYAVWRYFLMESSNARTGKKGFELWQVSFQWKEKDSKNSSHVEFEVVVTEIHEENNQYKLGRFVIHRFIKGKNKAVRTGNKIGLEIGYSRLKCAATRSF